MARAQEMTDFSRERAEIKADLAQANSKTVYKAAQAYKLGSEDFRGMTNCQDYDFDSTPPWRPKDKYRGAAGDVELERLMAAPLKPGAVVEEMQKIGEKMFMDARGAVVERVGGSDEFPAYSYGFKWNLSEMMKEARAVQKPIEEVINEQAIQLIEEMYEGMFMDVMDVSDDHNITAPKPHSLDAVLALHERLCEEARELVKRKGADYNRTEQANGDTLANLKVAHRMGLVESPAHGVLVRLVDKLMRLKSLCKPGEQPANVDEKVRDTVIDVINYAVYVLALHEGDC